MWRPWGHSSIGRHCSDKTDYMTSGLHLGRIPKCTLERDGWPKGMEPRRNTFNIFTDGSKTPDGAGAGIFFNQLNLRQLYKLPNHCTIFQAEVFAMWKAVELAETRTTVNSVVNLYIDSQAAIKGITAYKVNSKLVNSCKGDWPRRYYTGKRSCR